MSNTIETAKFLRRYQSWRKGEIDVFYPDSHAGPNPVEISAAIDRAIVALEAQPPCGADGDELGSIKHVVLPENFSRAVVRDSLITGCAKPCWCEKCHAAMLASQPAAPVAPATVAVPDDSHPMQPIVLVDGVARFKQNAIVRYLLDNGGLDLNALALVGFSQEDNEQFAQLIGYSVSGFGDLSYARSETVGVADAIVDAMLAAKAKGGGA